MSQLTLIGTNWTVISILVKIGFWRVDVSHFGIFLLLSRHYKTLALPYECVMATTQTMGMPTNFTRHQDIPFLLSHCHFYRDMLCNFVTLTFDFWVMSRDATLVITPSTKFELDVTYFSRVRATTIFHWPPAQSPNFNILGVKGSNLKFSSF